MTCADVIGFHAYDYARHFLNACKRMLGLLSHTRQGGMLSLICKDREVVISMSHVSIEPPLIEAALKNPKTIELADAYRAKYKGKKVVVGVDVCQRLSGVVLKLAAFEKLLTDHITNNSVILVQKMIRPGAREADEASTSEDTLSMVNSLNSRFSSTGGTTTLVVDYEEVPHMSLIERCALWLVADSFLLTCIREGLNLMPLEYIYSRKDMKHAGCVVASEFSPCSSLLSGAIKVNPCYALEVADALDKALSMSSSECATRRQRDIGFISSHPSSLWTSQIMSDFRYLRKEMNAEATKTVKVCLPLPMQIDTVLKAYEAPSPSVCRKGRRIFIFDYGGTLLQKEKFDIYIKQTLSAISGRQPTSRMMDAIQRLSNDPNNAVMIVTGLTKLKLGDTFKEFENVSLATSNGLVYSWGKNLMTADEWIKQQSQDCEGEDSKSFEARVEQAILDAAKARRRGSSSTNLLAAGIELDNAQAATAAAIDSRQLALTHSLVGDAINSRIWECMDFAVDWVAVRNIAVPITTRFTFRTNGTCMSPRIPGIGWSYFGADPDWGQKQSQQLRVELEAALAEHDVMVTSQIQGSIEVVPRGLHKGVIVKKFLDRVMQHRADKLPEFCVIIGDEESDDKMFEAAYDLACNAPPSSSIKNMSLFTTCVGLRETPAALYLDDVKDVEDLLVTLAKSPTTVEVPTEVIETM